MSAYYNEKLAAQCLIKEGGYVDERSITEVRAKDLEGVISLQESEARTQARRGSTTTDICGNAIVPQHFSLRRL